MDFEYNWLGSLATLVISLGIMIGGRFLLFRISALNRARNHDKQENRRKLKAKEERYRGRLKSSNLISSTTNAVFLVAILPFFVTFEAQSIGTIALHVFLILMIYDLFYYLTHRFLFHGQGYLRMVHGVHHQARTRVSSVDALLLHPWEVFIGIALFFAVTSSLGLILGTGFHLATMVICTVIYISINQINHCRIDVQGFPYNTLHWIALNHDVHHINMHRGNYATISPLYDWLFRTLEPVNQPEQVEATQATADNGSSADYFEKAA